MRPLFQTTCDCSIVLIGNLDMASNEAMDTKSQMGFLGQPQIVRRDAVITDVLTWKKHNRARAGQNAARARNQWRQTAKLIPLNTADSNGKSSHKRQARSCDFAHGSSLDCGSMSDVLVTTGGLVASSTTPVVVPVVPSGSKWLRC